MNDKTIDVIAHVALAVLLLLAIAGLIVLVVLTMALS